MDLNEFLKVIIEFPKKNEMGFTGEELDNLLCLLADFYDKDSYKIFSKGHTVGVLDDGTIIHYPWDVRNDLKNAFLK